MTGAIELRGDVAQLTLANKVFEAASISVTSGAGLFTTSCTGSVAGLTCADATSSLSFDSTSRYVISDAVQFSNGAVVTLTAMSFSDAQVSFWCLLSQVLRGQDAVGPDAPSTILSGKNNAFKPVRPPPPAAAAATPAAPPPPPKEEKTVHTGFRAPPQWPRLPSRGRCAAGCYERPTKSRSIRGQHTIPSTRCELLFLPRVGTFCPTASTESWPRGLPSQGEMVDLSAD